MSNIGKQLLYIPKNVSVFKFINFIIFNYKNNIYKLKTFKNFKILFNKNALSFFCKLKKCQVNYVT